LKLQLNFNDDREAVCDAHIFEHEFMYILEGGKVSTHVLNTGTFQGVNHTVGLNVTHVCIAHRLLVKNSVIHITICMEASLEDSMTRWSFKLSTPLTLAYPQLKFHVDSGPYCTLYDKVVSTAADAAVPIEQSMTLTGGDLVALTQETQYRDARAILIRREGVDFSGASVFGKDHNLSLSLHVSFDHPEQPCFSIVLVGSIFHDRIGLYKGVFDDKTRTTGLDLSISYDYGAELNGFAAAYNFFCMEKSQLDLKGPCSIHNNDWIYTQTSKFIRLWYPNNIWQRGAGFVVLACARMSMAKFISAVERNFYRHCMEILGVKLLDAGEPGSVDETAALVLVYSVLFHHFPATSLASVSRRKTHDLISNLNYSKVGNMLNSASRQEDPEKITVFVNSKEYGADTIFWVFKAGLLARAIGFARTSNILEDDDNPHLQNLVSKSVEEIMGTVQHMKDGSAQIRTSRLSGETNSETQSWALLGLLPTSVQTSGLFCRPRKCQNADLINGSNPESYLDKFSGSNFGFVLVVVLGFRFFWASRMRNTKQTQ